MTKTQTKTQSDGDGDGDGDGGVRSSGHAEEVAYNAQGKKKGKHDKPKPWDTPDIDHWKIEPFQASWNAGGLLEESSFSTLFPQYRGIARTLPPTIPSSLHRRPWFAPFR
jgi:hypothetical protein